MKNLSRNSLSIAALSGLVFTGITTILNPMSAEAALIKPTGMTVTVPTGSNNGSLTGNSGAQAYVDDVFLNSLSFGGTTFTNNSDINNSNFRSVQSAEVMDGFGNINAEYGDSDTNSDGNDNPFYTSGVYSTGTPINTARRETTDPNIQNPAITAAFNGLSINEGIDGEETIIAGSSNQANYVLDLVFQNGIVDDNNSADSIPELVFFERGANSDFTVEAITGTLANKTYSSAVTVNRTDMWNSGKFINTTEIPNGQRLGVVGIDLSDFGIAPDEIVFGVRITSINNSGADLYGNFLSGDTSQFRDVPTGAVPAPGVWAGYALIAGIFSLFRRQSQVKRTAAVKAE